MKKLIYLFCLLAGCLSCDQENTLLEKEIIVKPAPILPPDTLSSPFPSATDTLQIKDWNTIIVEGNVLQTRK